MKRDIKGQLSAEMLILLVVIVALVAVAAVSLLRTGEEAGTKIEEKAGDIFEISESGLGVGEEGDVCVRDSDCDSGECDEGRCT